MSKIASQITSLTIVYSTVYSGPDQTKHQSSASLAFVRGSHRGPVNSQMASNAENVSIWWRHHNIRHHPHSSFFVKRQEFDDKRGLFCKRSRHFGIKNLKQYLRLMNEYILQVIAGKKGSVDSKATMWLRNTDCPLSISRVYTAKVMCNDAIAWTIAQSKYRSPSVGTVLCLQVHSP